MSLTEQEMKYLEAFEWLISDGFSDEDFRNRATGRSFLLAYCFIKKALKHPNTWIRVWDHIPDFIAHERQLRHIQGIININEEFKDIKHLLKINRTKNSIMIGT